MMRFRMFVASGLLCLLGLSAASAQIGPRGGTLPQQGGEAIYKSVCQACHMPDARGASGAGAYPALARNPKLAEPGYPVAVVVHGQKAMPAFGDALSDQQIADVVNYVRSHFGNAYTDAVSADDVKGAR